jgi:hypothetical protein
MKAHRISILAAIALILASTAAHAQVALGIRGGANFATVHATETLDQLAPDFRFTPGYDVAGVAEINFGDYFALQPEVHWVQKGFRFAETFDIPVSSFNVPAGVEATFRTNYIEVPLLAKVKLGNDVVQAYAAVGPSFGYALNARLITRPRVLIEFDPINTDVDLETIDYERFDVGGTGVLGLQLNFSGVKVFADARYTHGFTELYDFPLINEKVRNRGFSVGAGVMFDLTSAGPKKPLKRQAGRTGSGRRPRA